MSRDPIKAAELLSDGPNIYSYVANDPVNYADLSGEFAGPPPVETIEVCVIGLAAAPVEIPVGAIVIGTTVVCGVVYAVYQICKKKPKKVECHWTGVVVEHIPSLKECQYKCKDGTIIYRGGPPCADVVTK